MVQTISNENISFMHMMLKIDIVNIITSYELDDIIHEHAEKERSH